jgi:multiple sugar transport system ATP-binding protein
MGELELRGLSKRYGDGDNGVLAVDDIDLTIADGEFVVLVGPSGCGKSTTLRIVAGLEQATEGQVLLDDEDITRAEPKNRNVAMVFQNYALYPHKSAYDNMAFGLRMSTDLSQSAIDERVRETAALMDIEELLDSKPDELSGGQQQRVALGRAIVREPDVFLMDEPLSNLDAKLRSQMRTELQELQRDLGVTTLYVTHDQTEAMTMGDRIAVLNEGRLQQCASPLECYHEPANEFVAGFIGSPGMNFFEVTREGDRLVNEAFEYPLKEALAPAGERVPEGTQLHFGIRPEDIEVVTVVTEDERAVAAEPDGGAMGEAATGSIRATVRTVEPMGDVTVVSATVGEQSITASEPGSVEASRGDRIEFRFPASAVHLFDAESGETILQD